MSSDDSYVYPNFNKENSIKYKKKMIYFTSKALIYGCLFSFLLRKPRTVFPLAIGLAAGYCNEDLFKIFYSEIK